MNTKHPAVYLILFLFCVLLVAADIVMFLMPLYEKWQRKMWRMKYLKLILETPDASNAVEVLEQCNSPRVELIWFLMRLGSKTYGITPLHFKALELLADYPMLTVQEYLDIFNATPYLTPRQEKDWAEMLQNNCKGDLTNFQNSYDKK